MRRRPVCPHCGEEIMRGRVAMRRFRAWHGDITLPDGTLVGGCAPAKIVRRRRLRIVIGGRGWRAALRYGRGSDGPGG